MIAKDKLYYAEDVGAWFVSKAAYAGWAKSTPNNEPSRWLDKSFVLKTFKKERHRTEKKKKRYTSSSER